MPSIALVCTLALTVRECATLAGKSPSWVRDKIQSGALRAARVDGRYMVPSKSMARLMQLVRPARAADSCLRLVVDNTVFKK